MSAVWHDVLSKSLLLPDKHTWELCSPGNSFGKKTKTMRLPLFKPLQTAVLVWFRLHVHKCIHNGVWRTMCAFGFVCRKL